VAGRLGLCGRREVGLVPWAPCGRRGDLADPLGPVWPREGVAGPLGLVWLPWERGRATGPRVAAVGAWPVPRVLYACRGAWPVPWAPCGGRGGVADPPVN